MTPAESILGQLSHGPCNASSLACYMHSECGISVTLMYQEFFKEIALLIKSGDVEHNAAQGYYRLTTRRCPDVRSKADASE